MKVCNLEQDFEMLIKLEIVILHMKREAPPKKKKPLSIW
jgi:hypothetical protein